MVYTSFIFYVEKWKVELRPELAAFSMEQNPVIIHLVIQSWIFGRYFLENEVSEPVSSRKRAWREKSNFGTFISAISSLTASQYLTVLLMRLEVLSVNVIVLIVKKEVHQHLEDLCNSVNQYFVNDQCVTLQNHAYVYKIHSECK